MNSAEDSHKPNIEHLLQSGATITFLFQLLLFFLSYNISAEIIMLGTGWILLVPGFAIIFLSIPLKSDNDDHEEKKLRAIYNYSGYPTQIGWSIVSIAMALITQTLLSVTLSVIFISFLILIIRENRVDLET